MTANAVLEWLFGGKVCLRNLFFPLFMGAMAFGFAGCFVVSSFDQPLRWRAEMVFGFLMPISLGFAIAIVVLSIVVGEPSDLFETPEPALEDRHA